MSPALFSPVSFGKNPKPFTLVPNGFRSGRGSRAEKMRVPGVSDGATDMHEVSCAVIVGELVLAIVVRRRMGGRRVGRLGSPRLGRSRSFVRLRLVRDALETERPKSNPRVGAGSLLLTRLCHSTTCKVQPGRKCFSRSRSRFDRMATPAGAVIFSISGFARLKLGNGQLREGIFSG
jgi:hypothetical protein